MKLSIRLAPATLLLLFAVMYLAGCGYLQKGAAVAVDVVVDYCEANPTVSGRELVRTGIHSEAVSEDIEICLGCPGDEETFCVGPGRLKVDDPGS